MNPEAFREIRWRQIPEFIRDCRSHPLPGPLRMLLMSDGSVVGGLRALLLDPVSVDLLESQEVALDTEEAGLFRLAEGTKGIRRKIWLLHDRSRWVYAVSFFALTDLSPRFYREVMHATVPLGSLIEARGYAARRDGVEICRQTVPDLAREFGEPDQTALWGRRYRLDVSGEGSGSIFELFSPRLDRL